MGKKQKDDMLELSLEQAVESASGTIFDQAAKRLRRPFSNSVTGLSSDKINQKANPKMIAENNMLAEPDTEPPKPELPLSIKGRNGLYHIEIGDKKFGWIPNTGSL
jgi:hypothetical protein